MFRAFVKLKDKPMVVYSNELSNEALLLASYLKNDFAVEVTLEEGKDKGDVILYWIRPILPDEKRWICIGSCRKPDYN